MKPIRIQFEGVNAQNGEYKFDNHVGDGLLLLSGVDVGLLADALRFAFFGGDTGDDAARRVEFRFAVGERTYDLTRVSNRSGGERVDSAMLQDAESGQYYVTGAAETEAYLLDLTKINRGLFDKLFLLPKEDVAEALCDPQQASELLGEVFNADVTAEDVSATLETLREGERRLSAHIEEIGPVDKKAISEHKQIIERNEHAKTDAEKEYETALEDVKCLDIYDAAAAEQAQYGAERDKLEATRADIDELNEKLEKSRKAAATKEAYEKSAVVLEELEADRAALAEKQKERAALTQKITDGEASYEKYKSEFLEGAVRAEEWQAAFLQAVREVDSDENVGFLRDAVNAQYADQMEEAQQRAERLDAIAEEIRANEERLTELKNRKQTIAVTAEYRNAVAEGAILETRLAAVDTRLRELDEKLLENRKAHENLTESDAEQERKETEYAAKQAELERAILGTYPSIKDAVNADVLYKQTIYAKHLAVSMQQVELRAVEDKMEAVRKVNEGYRAKREVLERRKEQVEAHRKKLMLRLDAVEEKLRDLITRNRLRQMADEAEYGSKCPICNGYVTVKKQLPVVPTTSLEDQANQLKAEIEKDTEVINDAATSIGQYQAAERVSEQYLQSLNETKEAKEKLINDTLSEYAVADVPELFLKVRATVDNSNRLTQSIDQYHMLNAELGRIRGERAGMQEEIKRLALVIEQTTAQQTELTDEMQKLLDRYAILQPHFSGENALDLNDKLYVTTNEYEKLEQEEAALQEKLDEMRKQEEELRVGVTRTCAYGDPLVLKGKEYDYLGVTAKILGERYRALAQQMEEAADQEKAKLRLAAIGKVVERAKEEASALDEEITKLDSTVQAKEAILGLVSDLDAKLAELGVKDVASLDALILSAPVQEGYSVRIEGFNTDLARLNSWLEHATKTIEEYAPYAERREDILQRFAEAGANKDEALIAYDRAVEAGKAQAEAYEDYTLSSHLLTRLQEKIAYAAENLDLVVDGTLDVEKVRERIIADASRKIRRLTIDRYDLRTDSEGKVALHRIGKDESVAADKASPEEGTLRTLSLSLSYVDLILKVIGGELQPVLYWAGKEDSSEAIRYLNDFSKDLPLAVCPANEVGFLDAAGTLEG